MKSFSDSSSEASQPNPTPTPQMQELFEELQKRYQAAVDRAKEEPCGVYPDSYTGLTPEEAMNLASASEENGWSERYVAEGDFQLLYHDLFCEASTGGCTCYILSTHVRPNVFRCCRAHLDLFLAFVSNHCVLNDGLDYVDLVFLRVLVQDCSEPAFNAHHMRAIVKSATHRVKHLSVSNHVDTSSDEVLRLNQSRSRIRMLAQSVWKNSTSVMANNFADLLKDEE